MFHCLFVEGPSDQMQDFGAGVALERHINLFELFLGFLIGSELNQLYLAYRLVYTRLVKDGVDFSKVKILELDYVFCILHAIVPTKCTLSLVILPDR